MSTCTLCEKPVPAVHWAFDEPHGFSTDLTRYRPLCAKCHGKADLGKAVA